MGTPMDRRQFLRRAGALTASVGSVALLGGAAGCTRSPATVPKAAPVTVPVTTGPPDWAELAQMLSGSVIVPSETAFVHRNALAGIQMIANWGSGTEPSDSASWLAAAGTDLAPYTSGAYQNYIDPTLSDWQQAYYGANLPRLVKVKARVDPDDFFHFAQSIPMTLSSRT
jgi:hypothetical protein